MLADVVAPGKDDVVARGAGLYARIHGLVAVEQIISDLYAGFFFEIGDGGRADIVRPVVDEELALLGFGLTDSRQQRQQRGNPEHPCP
jgi:hypothetical protein